MRKGLTNEVVPELGMRSMYGYEEEASTLSSFIGIKAAANGTKDKAMLLKLHRQNEGNEAGVTLLSSCDQFMLQVILSLPPSYETNVSIVPSKPCGMKLDLVLAKILTNSRSSWNRFKLPRSSGLSFNSRLDQRR